MSKDCNLDGFGLLDVWVSKLGDPCRKSDKTWYVTIWSCTGDVLSYCGKNYVVIPASCGHLRVKLPPGTYYVSAVWSFSTLPGGESYQANHFTDATLVEICCNSCSCITLYNPEVHRCGQILLLAAQDQVNQALPGWDQVQQDALVAAMAPLLTAAPLQGPQLELDPQIDALAIERTEQPPPGGLADAINPIDDPVDLAIDYIVPQ